MIMIVCQGACDPPCKIQADLPSWLCITDHLSVTGRQAEPALLPDGAVAMHQQTLLVVHRSSRCQCRAL